MLFRPDYYNGGVFPSSYAETTFCYEGNNPSSMGEYAVAEDCVVCALSDRPGDTLGGWFGSVGYDGDWDNQNHRSHVGYPDDVGGEVMPAWELWFSMLNSWQPGFFEFGHGLDILTHGRMNHGDSGEPLFGWWSDGGPYSGDPSVPYIIGVAGAEGEPPPVVTNYSRPGCTGNWAAGGNELPGLASVRRYRKICSVAGNCSKASRQSTGLHRKCRRPGVTSWAYRERHQTKLARSRTDSIRHCWLSRQRAASVGMNFSAGTGCAGAEQCDDEPMVRCFAVLLLTLPVTAAADPGPVVIDLTYTGYASGFRVVTMQSELQLTPNGYRIAMAGQTAGVVGFVYHAHWQSWADGVWNGPNVTALHFDNHGVYGGDPRQVAIAFRGSQAAVPALQPPDDGEHTPVPPMFTHNVIDGLSLTALVVHQVATLGHCAGQVTTFDGRQVESLALAGDGTEMLPTTGRSDWRGPTLRCRIGRSRTGGSTQP